MSKEKVCKYYNAGRRCQKVLDGFYTKQCESCDKYEIAEPPSKRNKKRGNKVRDAFEDRDWF